MNRDNRQALDLDSLDLVTGGVAGSQAPTPKLNVNMHDLLDPFYGTNHAGAASAFTLEIPLMGPGAMSGMPEVPTMPVAEAAEAPVGVKVCGNTNHASPTTAEVDTLSDAEQAKAEMDAAHAQGLSQAEAALAALEAEAGADAGGCGGDDEPAVQAQADDGDGDGGGCGAGDGSGGGDGGGDGGGCGDDEDEDDDDDDDDAMYADEGDDAVAYDDEVPAEEAPAEPPVMQCGDGSPSSVGDEPADELAYPASVPNAVWVGTGEEQIDDGNVMHTQVEDSIAAPQVIGEYAETASVPDAQWVGYEGDDAQVALEGQAASVPDAQWVGYEGQEDVSASVPDAVWADSSAEQEDEPSSDDDWDLSQAGDELDQALEDHGVNLPIDFGNLGATVEGMGNDKSVGISKEDIVAGINSAIRG